MEAQAYVGAGQVAIDTCEHCGLNWLDHGELARIAHPPASDFVAESNAADCSNDGDSYFAGPQAAQVVEYNNL
jgi:Zn-finger nucleic acid-binding protein